MAKTITDAQWVNLSWLADHGGSGYLDRYGRLVAGGETSSQGAWVSWFNLIAKGLIAGGDDRLTITDEGRKYLKPALTGEQS